MKRLSLLLTVLMLSLVGYSQIIIYPNSGIYGVGYNRIVPLNTLWLPTGCGAPVGKVSLNAPGTNPRQAAVFADTCGHHIYWYDPSDSGWSRIDTGGGGGGAGTVTAILVSNDSLYYTTSSGNTFVAVILEQYDSTVKYVTPTQLAATASGLQDTTFVKSDSICYIIGGRQHCVLAPGSSGGGAGHTYLAGAGIIMSPNDTTISVDSVWKIEGDYYIYPTAVNQQGITAEPALLFRDPNSILLGLPSGDTVWKIIYDGGSALQGVYYAESKSGKPGTYVQDTNQIISNHGRTCAILDITGDSILFLTINISTLTADTYWALKSSPTTVHSIATNVLAYNTGVWNQYGYTNSNAIVDTLGAGTGYKLIIDGNGGNQGVANVREITEGLFTSPDWRNWTQYAGNPVLQMESPCVVKIPGITYPYWLWGHMLPKKSTDYYYLPTDLFGAYSQDMIHWHYVTYNGNGRLMPVLPRSTSAQGIDSAWGQAADPQLYHWSSNGHDSIRIVFSESQDGANQAEQEIASYIFTGTFAQLVATNQNMRNVPLIGTNGNTMYMANPLGGEELCIGCMMQQSEDLYPSLLRLGAGDGTTVPFQFDLSGTARLYSNPSSGYFGSPGALQPYGPWLFYTGVDTFTHLAPPQYTDTVAMRGWARSSLPLGWQGMLNFNNAQTKNDSVNLNGTTLNFYGGGNTFFNLLSLAGPSSIFTLNGGTLTSQDQTTGPQAFFGDALSFTGYSSGNAWIGFGGTSGSGATFQYPSSGGTAGFYLRNSGGAYGLLQFPTGTAGANITNLSYPMFVPAYNGTSTSNILINSTTDYANAQVQITNPTSAQLSLNYNPTYGMTMFYNSGVYQIAGYLTGMNILTSAFGAGISGDSLLSIGTSGGIATYHKLAIGTGFSISGNQLNNSQTLYGKLPIGISGTDTVTADTTLGHVNALATIWRLYQVTDSMAAVNSIFNFRTDPASDSLMVGVGPAVGIRGIQDTSHTGRITISKTYSTTGTVVYDLDVPSLPSSLFRFSDSICNTINGVRVCVLDSAGGGGSSPPFPDNSALIENNSDHTKTFLLTLNNQTTSTLITDSVPTTNTMLAGVSVSNTFGPTQNFSGNLLPTSGTQSIGSSANAWVNFYGQQFRSPANLIMRAGAADSIQFQINGVNKAYLLPTGQQYWNAYIGNTFPGTVTGGTPDSVVTINNGLVREVPVSGIATSPLLFSQTANGPALTNTTSVSGIMGIGTSSATIAANTLSLGQTITLEGFSILSTAASPGTLSLIYILGGGSASVTFTPPALLSSQGMKIKLVGEVITTGSSGTINVSAEITINGNYPVIVNVGSITVNTTSSMAINIEAQWGTASSSNSIQTVPPLNIKVQ